MRERKGDNIFSTALMGRKSLKITVRLDQREDDERNDKLAAQFREEREVNTSVSQRNNE